MTFLVRLTLIPLLLTLISCTSLIEATTDEPIQFHPGKRSFGTMLNDQKLETASKVNIRKASTELEEAHINVVAYNGMILLVGQVSSQELRLQAGSIVKEIHGVRQVFNEIQIQGKTSMLARSNDTWLTTKVKTNLMANKDIDGGRVKVITEDGVVYLMGLLSQREAEKAADVVSRIGGVQKVVKAIEYIN